MMQNRKTLAALLIAALLLLLLIPGCGKQGAQPLDIYYFYDNPCLSCDDEGAFTSFFNEQTGDIKDYCSYRLHIVNTFSGGSDELEKQLERLGLSTSDYSGYLLTMGDSFLLGEDITAEGKLRQMFWRETGLGGTPEVFEYYYRDDCKDCQNIKETMDTFFAAHPEIPTVCLDTNDVGNKEAFKALLSSESVPSERVQIPYVIYQGRHYSGNAEIEAALADF